jgi:hypothetical protein
MINSLGGSFNAAPLAKPKPTAKAILKLQAFSEIVFALFPRKPLVRHGSWSFAVQPLRHRK